MAPFCNKDKDLKRCVVQKTIFIIRFIWSGYIYKSIIRLESAKLTAFEQNIIMAHYIVKKLPTFEFFLSEFKFCKPRKVRKSFSRSMLLIDYY